MRLVDKAKMTVGDLPTHLRSDTARRRPERVRPAGERFAERCERLAAVRGRLLTVGVVVTLLLWAALFYGIVAEHVETVAHL